MLGKVIKNLEIRIILCPFNVRVDLSHRPTWGLFSNVGSCIFGLLFFIISQGPYCYYLLTCRFLSIEIQLIFLWYKDNPKITASLPYEINQFTNLTTLLQLVLLKLNLWGESALPCCWLPLSLGKWLYGMCSFCISTVILFSCFFLKNMPTCRI